MKKLKTVCILGMMLLLLNACSGQNTKETVDISTVYGQDITSIIGTYVGEENGWILQIYEDNTLHASGRKYGHYDKLTDNKWLLEIIDGANGDFDYSIKADLTDEGNLYLTAASSDLNWEPEMFHRQILKKPLKNKFDLAKGLGENWDDFREELISNGYDDFEILQTYDDGQLGIGDDLSIVYMETDPDNILCLSVLGTSVSNYSLCGVYVSQDYQEAQKLLKKNDFELMNSVDNDDPQYPWDTSFTYEKGNIALDIYVKAKRIGCVQIDRL